MKLTTVTAEAVTDSIQRSQSGVGIRKMFWKSFIVSAHEICDAMRLEKSPRYSDSGVTLVINPNQVFRCIVMHEDDEALYFGAHLGWRAFDKQTPGRLACKLTLVFEWP
jgi:hypothetical protein